MPEDCLVIRRSGIGFMEDRRFSRYESCRAVCRDGFPCRRVTGMSRGRFVVMGAVEFKARNRCRVRVPFLYPGTEVLNGFPGFPDNECRAESRIEIECSFRILREDPCGSPYCNPAADKRFRWDPQAFGVLGHKKRAAS